jgi:hypothetical protein
MTRGTRCAPVSRIQPRHIVDMKSMISVQPYAVREAAEVLADFGEFLEDAGAALTAIHSDLQLPMHPCREVLRTDSSQSVGYSPCSNSASSNDSTRRSAMRDVPMN